MGHYVYKYVHKGKIVYIGKNDNNLISRISSHKSESKFKPYLSSDIYYITLANKAETRTLETLLINKYKPKLNVIDKYDSITSSFLKIQEPKWEKYDEKKFKKQPAITKAISEARKKTAQKEIDQLIIRLNRYQELYKKKDLFKKIKDSKIADLTDLNYNKQPKFTIDDFVLELPYTQSLSEEIPMCFWLSTKDTLETYTIFEIGIHYEKKENGNIVCFFSTEKNMNFFFNNYNNFIKQQTNKIRDLALKYKLPSPFKT